MIELGPGTFKGDTDSCPVCGTKLDAFSNMHGEAQPTPGSISICYKCTSYLIIEEGLKLRELDIEEMLALPNETLVELTGARSRLKKHNAQHMNKFRPYVPRYIDTRGLNLEEVLFDSTKDLLRIEHVQKFTKHPDFTEFVISNDLLMALLREGEKWLVVGFIKEPDKVDLPRWRGPPREEEEDGE